MFLGVLVSFGCDENEISPTNDSFQLARILNYSSSTSSEPYGFVKFEYASNGNLIKESMVDYPNTLTSYKLYEYSGNKVIKQSIYDGQVGNLSLGTYIIYSYTNDQLTKEELFLADGTLKYATIYELEGERIINTYKIDDLLGIHHQQKYTFDNLNRLILEEVFMYNSELSKYTKHFYDSINRLVKSEVYDSDGTITSSVEKIYHGLDNLPDEELYFDQSGTQTQKKQLAYDSWGNLIDCVVVGPGTSCPLVKRRYNGELLTEEIKYHPYFGCTEWSVARYEYAKK